MEITSIFLLELCEIFAFKSDANSKKHNCREFFKKFPEVKKQLWGGEFWSDGGYIGTVGDGVMADTIRNYVETQGTPEEKEGYKQMNLQKLANYKRREHAPLLATWNLLPVYNPCLKYLAGDGTPARLYQ